MRGWTQEVCIRDPGVRPRPPYKHPLSDCRPRRDFIPADHAMPLGPHLILAVAVLFPAHAARDREAKVLIAVRRDASLGVLTNKPDGSNLILPKHYLVFLPAPTGGDDPER